MTTIDDGTICPEHKQVLVLQPKHLQPYEQTWCGDWYICPVPGCHRISVNVPSAELLAELERQRVEAAKHATPTQAALF